MLYLVATPIGNLEDITLRALNTLFSVDLVLAEDTRKTANLLKHYQKEGQVLPPLLSYFEENEPGRIPQIIARLKSGESIALVSSGGAPTISDPGFKLVREALKEGIKVVPIPGPTSVIAAISASGLPTDKFIFLGFPSPKPSGRLKLFENLKKSLAQLPATVIFFESPHRLCKSLLDLQSVFGDIEVVLASEITKVYEKFEKGKISTFLKNYPQNPKGEFVVLFNLRSQEATS